MTDRSHDPILMVLRHLKDAFPTGLDLDYYTVLGVSATANAVSDAELTKFKALNAAIQLLAEQDVVRADRFDDARDTYFWNVRLTGRGYRLLTQNSDVLDAEDPRDTLAVLSRRK